MKQHLLDSLNYNDWANLKLLAAIETLGERNESISLFSHLITAQNKWYNRITKQEDDTLHSWSSPLFQQEELKELWQKSISNWINYIEAKTESELQENVVFTRTGDGKQMGIKLLDLVLQINYHSIHHRAQINKLMSEQGTTPPATDYIYTKLIEL